MSFSIWARAARTCLIRPRVGSGPLLGRSYVLLAAKPSTSVLLRPVSLMTRQQSTAAALLATPPENITPPPLVEETASGEQLPDFSTLQGVVHGGVLRALTRGPFNLTTMSSVQAEVLPLLPEIARPYDSESPPTPPRDLLVKAKTGTGKTLAFLIPAVEARLKALDEHVKKATETSGLEISKSLADSTRRRYAQAHTGVVIISPTRELATQIANEARKLVRHLDLEVHLFVGGESKGAQLRAFRRGTHDIIVATPGRMNDMLDSVEAVSSSVAHTQTLILDEADSLLDMGFQPDILAIQKFMPPSPQRQTFLFSATISRAIRDVARQSLAKEHRFINCVSDDAPPTHAHIPQYHTVLPSAEHQLAHTLRILAHDQLANPGKSKSLVFLPTTKMTQLFAELLREVKTETMPAGINTQVYEIHSKKSMDSRVRTSRNFRNDTSGASILVTSDVSARGVDYPGVTRVVQVGIPSSAEQYVHRVGRTGRAGLQGRGDLVLLPWERKFVSDQMNEVPLKPLTMEDHNSQLLELAKTYDADPKAFWGGEIPTVKSFGSSSLRGGRPSLRSRTLFRASSIAPSLEEIPRTVSEAIARADEETISETFMSLLGYYTSRTSELKMSKLDIVEACKEWCVNACGLPRAPFVSSSMLDRLGVRKEIQRMDRVRRDGFREPRKSPWMYRGQAKVREEFGRGGRGRDRDNDWSEDRNRDRGGYRNRESNDEFSRSRNVGRDRDFGRDKVFGGDRKRVFERASSSFRGGSGSGSGRSQRGEGVREWTD